MKPSSSAPHGLPATPVMGSLPRRKFITLEPTEVTPPMMQTQDPPVTFWRVVVRLLAWMWLGLRILGGNFMGRLRGQEAPADRALRFKRAVESGSEPVRKVAQLLAMRIDLLPWSYAAQLTGIVDEMPPFALAQAAALVEKATGGPLEKIFLKFDPQPIVANTISCTYQAVLANGQKVGVKVKRPGIGSRLMEEVRALEWLLRFAEFMSLYRYGYTQGLRRELRQAVRDEMNFTAEARHQDLFRESANAVEAKKRFFTAPVIYFDLSSDDVIIQEYSTGMWLWELIDAVEHGTESALARARELNIDPVRVARRLLWVNFWGQSEHHLFLADLQVDNVIIGQGGELIFIDFSAVGALSQEHRRALEQTIRAAGQRDPLGMAQASTILLEPLPPLDMVDFTKSLESRYWQFLYALESRQIDWWERTSIRLWVSLVAVAREYHVPMQIHVLRMIRANLLYDITAARLAPRIDHVREYQKFYGYQARQARKRVQKKFWQQFEDGLDTSVFMQFENVASTSERLLHRVERSLAVPAIKFNAVIGKSVYFLTVLFSLLWQLVLVTLLVVGAVLAAGWLRGEPAPGWLVVLAEVASSPVYLGAAVLLLVLNIRKMLFRLNDKDI